MAFRAIYKLTDWAVLDYMGNDPIGTSEVVVTWAICSLLWASSDNNNRMTSQ